MSDVNVLGCHNVLAGVGTVWVWVWVDRLAPTSQHSQSLSSSSTINHWRHIEANVDTQLPDVVYNITATCRCTRHSRQHSRRHVVQSCCHSFHTDTDRLDGAQTQRAQTSAKASNLNQKWSGIRISISGLIWVQIQMSAASLSHFAECRENWLMTVRNNKSSKITSQRVCRWATPASDQISLTSADYICSNAADKQTAWMTVKPNRSHNVRLGGRT